MIIDQHLFIEGLALSALHIDTSNYPTILSDDKLTIEKILILIEKIASSDGLGRSQNNKHDPTFKNKILHKFDILSAFKSKYGWYFQKKNTELQKNQTKNNVL